MSSTEHAPRIAPIPGCSFVARITFDYGPLKFNAGDPFPHADLGMTEDAAWNFWRSTLIDVAPGAIADPPAAPASSSPATKPAVASAPQLQRSNQHRR
jgi:hypothetical protein